MSGADELLALRLALIGILLLFVIGAALALRAGVAPRGPSTVRRREGARAARPRLVVSAPALSGLAVGAEFVLVGETTIGRDGVNGIVLADGSVSGRHAQLAPGARGWVLRDLGSTNGTFVDSHSADGDGLVIRDGATVTIGSVGFRFYG